jgi:pimeloyl-ACP methyl ester carboxylesterase
MVPVAVFAVSKGRSMISRRGFAAGVGAVAAGAVAASVTGCGPAPAAAGATSGGDPSGAPAGPIKAATERADNVVLVHGLYADGSCWSGVIPVLQAAGLTAQAVQNPLTSIADAAAEVRRVLALQTGPTVLVGHSFAGTIISEVGADEGITALAYISARAPDAGEDWATLAKNYPAPPASAGVQTVAGWSQLSEQAFLSDFAQDVDPAKARVLCAAQGRNTTALVTETTTVAAWRTRPTWYQVSRMDRTIDPDLERFVAKRMNAVTIELDTSHLGLVSQPDRVAALILAAAGRAG